MSIPAPSVRRSLDTNGSAWESVSEEDRQAVFGEYIAFTNEVREAGALVSADPLQPTSTATTVRARDGETLTTDGPFAETKEQLGGYYIVEADSIDEAIEWASKIPSARGGSIEVRPVMPVSAEARQG